MPETAADLRFVPVLTGQSGVMGVVGLAASVVTVALAVHPWVVAAADAVGVVAGVATAWLLSRRTYRGLFDGLPVLDAPPRRSDATAVRFGARWGLVALALGALALVLEAELVFDDSTYALGGPLALSFAALGALHRRDLLRRQERQGVVLCLRVGARRHAWTRAQAKERLVLVSTGAGLAQG